MIGRFWRGWTTRENADAYGELVRTKILPGIHRIDGYRGAYLLRRDVEDGVEFATVTLWDSLDAVRAFASDKYDVAVVPSEARAVLARFDETSAHYEILAEP